MVIATINPSYTLFQRQPDPSFTIWRGPKACSVLLGKTELGDLAIESNFSLRSYIYIYIYIRHVIIYIYIYTYSPNRRIFENINWKNHPILQDGFPSLLSLLSTITP